jgi:hypothetical protein
MTRSGGGNSLHKLTIAGDSTVDWILVLPVVTGSLPVQSTYNWDLQIPVQIRAQPGGAALLHRGIASALKHQGTVVVSGPSLPEKAITDPRYDRLTRTYTIWQPFPVQLNNKELVWRMHRFLGVTSPATSDSVDVPDQDVPKCLVIDDANLGFRSMQQAWPMWLTEGHSGVRQILLKMSNPLGEGPLWTQLAGHYGDVLTVYCSVDDLRKEYASIGQALSWERSAIEVVRAIRSRKNLSLARRLIVSLGFSGAVIIERDGRATLVYDPRNQEGDWERKHPGLPVGLGTCVTAALATAASANLSSPDWVEGVTNGLLAARMLHDGRTIDQSGGGGPEFPLERVGHVIAGDLANELYRSVQVAEDTDWHISSVVSIDDFRAMAARIVVEGDEEACRDIPAERIGAWTSIDRMEIESMRSARGIAREYLLQSNPSRPLSLAVFGPPGSGKSFAIKQMTREPTAIPQKVTVLEFNLSQFNSPDDLPQAFQNIRDCAVERTLPLVFWDEFDTALDGAELGWVSRFLAPMQDGIFVDSGITRPIGPAIFIFAGGTHSTMASFKSRAMQIPEAKATDFLSRLRGYLDILGPNPMSKDDKSYVLRRALLLRGLLLSKAPGIRHQDRINIDPGVLRAFLDVSTYVHGARSMESIIDMSSLSGKFRYERSALPPMNQLGLHVDPEEFLALVHQES